ncbi:MAG: hypothetical protein IT461_07020 [Planctomycetes bacterium]|nr:hypothetical protein [Planctomycetota bacterium]
MGWTTQVVGVRHALFEDTTLLVVARMVVDEWSRTPAAFPSVSPHLERWHLQWAQYAPGVVDLNLETIASSYFATKELLQLLGIVEAQLQKRGPAIPRDEMRTRWSIGDVFWLKDQETIPFLDTTRSLKHLLEPVVAPERGTFKRIKQYDLGECPSCEQGMVCVAKRSDGRLFAICEECEAEWVDLALAPKREGMLPCGAAHDVWPPLWPTKEEIINAGLSERVEESDDEIRLPPADETESAE